MVSPGVAMATVQANVCDNIGRISDIVTFIHIICGWFDESSITHAPALRVIISNYIM